MYMSSNTKKWLNLLWYSDPRLMLNNSCHIYVALMIAGVGLSTALYFMKYFASAFSMMVIAVFRSSDGYNFIFW